MSADALSRRAALLRLGALALGSYTAPALTTLSMAEAKGSASSSGSSGASGSGNSGSGSSNSGSGSGSSPSGSGSSGSGSGNSGPGSGSSGSGSGTGSTPAASGGGSPVFGGDGLHIQFADGHIERIRNGRFERLDRRGRLVESRPASRSDLTRLRRLRTAAEGGGSQRQVRAVVEVDEQRGHIEITDYRGWREIVSGSTYELKDPDGRTVTRRALTAKDILRIRDTLVIE